MSRAPSTRLLFAAVVLLASALPVANASASARAAQKLTVYAVPATVQFMNHADDRLRGMSTNPFNLKAQAAIFNIGHLQPEVIAQHAGEMTAVRF